MKQKFMQQLNECKVTVGASDDDVSRFLAEDTSPTFKGKCIVSCLQEAFGLVWISTRKNVNHLNKNWKYYFPIFRQRAAKYRLKVRKYWAKWYMEKVPKYWVPLKICLRHVRRSVIQIDVKRHSSVCHVPKTRLKNTDWMYHLNFFKFFKLT